MTSKGAKGARGLKGSAIGNNVLEAKLDTVTHPLLKERIRGLTNIGTGRKKNQDAASAYVTTKDKKPHLILTVADGLGAYANSDKASYDAVKGIPLSRSEGLGLVECFEKKHQEIANRFFQANLSKDEGVTDMGCTTVVLVEIEGNKALIANVGDSRAYQIRGDKIIYQTRDQSMIELLIAEGRLKDPQEARRHPLRNVILNSLGSPEPAYQFYEKGQFVRKKSGIPIIEEIDLEKGDYLFLASDGTFTNLTDNEIIQLIRENPWDELENKLSKALQTVLKTGCTSVKGEDANPDNYTFIIYRHLDTL